jgi:hypothetical protein
MLRILIVATLLILVPATSALAGSPVARGESVLIQFGARPVGAQAFLQPTIRASLPSAAMHRTINSVASARAAAHGRPAPLGVHNMGGGRSGLALPVSRSVSLGLRYQYLRPEDMRLNVAESASLNEEYSSHSLVMRARWKF